MGKIISILIGSLTIILIFVIIVKNTNREVPPRPSPYQPILILPQPTLPQPTLPQPTLPPIETRIEPKWSAYPPVRNVRNLGKVLSDLENHMDYTQVPIRGIYRSNDAVTWAHETTHGINGVLRELYGYTRNSECLYCLDSRFVMIQEPQLARDIAHRYVPKSLRGKSNTVFGTLLRGYNVLYVLDEWVCYTNGSEVKLDLKLSTRGGTVEYMTQHMIYSLATAMAIKSKDPSYDDTQFKAFIKWNIERNFRILDQDKSGEGRSYLNTFRISGDAEGLRAFSRNWLGQDFTKKYFKF